jgi:DNA segregation ATPase FtsK/SpoIIIE, S-DNA-T family
VWVHPRLMDVTTAGNTLTLLVRARRGQTVDDLEKAAAPLAASASAVSWRSKPLTPSVLEVAMVMREELDTPAFAREPLEVEVDTVRMGRRQDGTDWRLQLRGRHTLVVGCSGSGKGSMLWNVCGGLAPAVKADLVRIWGVDLKKGVEIGMGRDLFHATADDMLTAIMCLARLLDVVDERGRRMAGITRLHEPAPGDPLHVLVIDELAALIGYSDPDLKREATRLLSIILTQGRALGVVVLGCVQDPRKETVTMRTLFTQTVALRLLNGDETRMVLGDGMAALAPAHRIPPTVPGTAWVIEDDGTVDRVRADYWPDPLIRTVAAAHRAPIVQDGLAGEARSAVVDLQSPISWSSRKPRSPRAPRAPRLPQRPQQDSGPTGGEAA